MADKSIRQDFLDGIEEVFSTLFNEAKEPEDGIQFFSFLGGSSNVYQESKFKRYAPPITLISSVSEVVQDGNTDVEAQKRHSIFKVPLKQLLSKGVIETDMTNEQLDEFENTEIKGTTNDYLNDYVSDKILNTNKTFEETTTNVIGVDWS